MSWEWEQSRVYVHVLGACDAYQALENANSSSTLIARRIQSVKTGWIHFAACHVRKLYHISTAALWICETLSKGGS